jgi:hypothetical protein
VPGPAAQRAVGVQPLALAGPVSDEHADLTGHLAESVEGLAFGELSRAAGGTIASSQNNGPASSSPSPGSRHLRI